MKYLKTYEEYRFKWNGIVEKDGNLYISLYKLANEMENLLIMKEKLKNL